jgi:hypothetical protein
MFAVRKALVVGVGVLGVGALAVWWIAFRQGPDVTVAPAGVRSVDFLPIPEGPPQPGFTNGVPDRLHLPIGLVEASIPDPLPGTLQQGIDCRSGADVVFHLTDGRDVSYGPCRIPDSITSFRAAAFAAIDDYLSETPSPEAVGAAMLALARSGRFQHPETGMDYDQPVDCRVYDPNGLRGQPIYLCAISIVTTSGQDTTGNLWEWGALVDGTLHTHHTDPKEVPTITGPWEPPWEPN